MILVTRIASVLLLPLLIIGSLNFIIDPDYTLRKDYIPAAASALANGKKLSGPVNANDRVLKKEWIKQLNYYPDLLVLGSSRTMGLTREQFEGKSIFNASVTNATFQDMYAFVDIFEKKQGSIPKEVIICCDQWLFGNAFQEQRWLSNRDHFINLLRKSGEIPPGEFPRKWELQKEWIKELFSVRYLIRSIRYFGRAEEFVVQDSVLPEKTMLLSDGSRLLPIQTTDPKPEDAINLATNYFYTSHDERFTHPDSLQYSLFENLIAYLQKRDCTVTLFIPPYHPVTWQLMHQSEQHAGVFKVDIKVQRIAQKFQTNLTGASDPFQLQLNSSHFYDGVHMKPEVLSQLLN